MQGTGARRDGVAQRVQHCDAFGWCRAPHRGEGAPGSCDGRAGVFRIAEANFADLLLRGGIEKLETLAALRCHESSVHVDLLDHFHRSVSCCDEGDMRRNGR